MTRRNRIGGEDSSEVSLKTEDRTCFRRHDFLDLSSAETFGVLKQQGLGAFNGDSVREAARRGIANAVVHVFPLTM